MDLLKISHNILSIKGGRHFQLFYKKNPELIKTLKDNTTFLPSTASPIERAYCIINNITSPIPCKICSNNVKWGRSKRKYKTYCSPRCKGKDPFLKNKVRQTCLEYHGVENPSQSEEIKKKKIKTCRLNHGVDFPQQSKTIRNLTYDTMKEKYQVSFPIQNQTIKHQIKNTMLMRYGVENPSQSEEIQKKKRQSSFEKYNRNHHSQQHIPATILENLNNKGWLYEQHYVLEKSLSQLSRELKVDGTTVVRYLRYHGLETQTPVGGSGFYCEHHFNVFPEDRTKDAYLYILQVYNQKEIFIKVGITTTSIQKRFNSNIPYTIRTLHEIPLPLYSAWLTEQTILKTLTPLKYQPEIPFGGKHECLLPTSYDEIINIINYLLS